MRISAKVDYAVRALAELAAERGVLKGEEIAQRQSLPLNFLENILRELRRAGVVSSQRGAVGGYRLAMEPSEVSIADVIRAVEGPLADVHGEPPEDLDYPGPAAALQQVWVATRANLRAVLETVTIAHIVSGRLPADVGRLVKRRDAWAKRR